MQVSSSAEADCLVGHRYLPTNNSSFLRVSSGPAAAGLVMSACFSADPHLQVRDAGMAANGGGDNLCGVLGVLARGCL